MKNKKRKDEIDFSNCYLILRPKKQQNFLTRLLWGNNHQQNINQTNNSVTHNFLVSSKGGSRLADN